MTKPAPLPYSTLDLGTTTGDGIHVYLTDATGRKIAAIWGKSDEKAWTADLLVHAANCHAEAIAALSDVLTYFEPFTLRPIGSPGSQARAQQDIQIAVHKNAKIVLAKMRGDP
jgi:hypothetical protein